MQKLTLGFSPCPNDTFIFDALVNNKINTLGFEFDVMLEDVQTLNQWAIAGKLDITKLSYAVLPQVLPQYKVLNSGGALGMGVGPLLITKNQAAKIDAEYVNNATIAIPGLNTTANFLFTQAYPNAKNKVFLRFDEIENFVAAGKGLGVIIHENRFTYQQKGLHKITDLGDYWEQQTGSPIPLGGIVIKRHFSNDTHKKIDTLIRQSVAFAFSHYPQLSTYVKQHSQEMEEQVMRQHIDLYVNDFSIQLGSIGQQAVNNMLQVLNYNAQLDTFV
jgi:1,4-dihydroxy-6-naphthoate synthase